MGTSNQKTMIQDYLRLSIEKDNLVNDLKIKEAELRKLELALSEAEDNLERLESNSIKSMLLSVMGKRATQLQEAQDEFNDITSKITLLKFEVDSTKNKVESNSVKINELYDSIVKFFDSNDISKQTLFNIKRLHELPILINDISKKIVTLKNMITAADEIYTFGDVRYNSLGHKYNRKETTMKEHARSIEVATNELINLLEAYNKLASDDISIAFHEEWMDDEKYWDNQQLASDSHQRITKVSDWLTSTSIHWRDIKVQQQEILIGIRNTIGEDYVN